MRSSCDSLLGRATLFKAALHVLDSEYVQSLFDAALKLSTAPPFQASTATLNSSGEHTAWPVNMSCGNCTDSTSTKAVRPAGLSQTSQPMTADPDTAQRRTNPLSSIIIECRSDEDNSNNCRSRIMTHIDVSACVYRCSRETNSTLHMYGDRTDENRPRHTQAADRPSDALDAVTNALQQAGTTLSAFRASDVEHMFWLSMDIPEGPTHSSAELQQYDYTQPYKYCHRHHLSLRMRLLGKQLQLSTGRTSLYASISSISKQVAPQ